MKNLNKIPELCNVCNERKVDVTKIRTYNKSFVSACKTCKEDMKVTLQLMGVFADSMERLPNYQRSSNYYVVSPCN